MNNEKNMFEVATREHYRFPFKGNASVEDLWLLEVEDLDSIFRILNKELKKVSEESLLNTKSQKDKEIEAKIEIIKYIVKVKLDEEAARFKAKERKEKKQKIMSIISDKKDAELHNMPIDKLEKMLEEL